MKLLCLAFAGALALASPAAAQIYGNANSGAQDARAPVKIGCVYNATRPTVTDGQRVDCQADQSGAMSVASAATAAPANAVPATATAVAAGSLIAKASAGNMYSWRVTTGGTAGYVMVFNSTTVPADGTVTPVDCVAVAANATVGSTTDAMPEAFTTGITLVFSSTGCFSKTISATAFIRARVK